MRVWVVSPLLAGKGKVEVGRAGRVGDLRRALRRQLFPRRRLLVFFRKRQLRDKDESLAALGVGPDSTVSVLAKLGSGLVGRLDLSDSSDDSQEPGFFPPPQPGASGPGPTLFFTPMPMDESQEPTSPAPAARPAQTRERAAAEGVEEGARRAKGSALIAALLSRQRQGPRVAVSEEGRGSRASVAGEPVVGPAASSARASASEAGPARSVCARCQRAAGDLAPLLRCPRCRLLHCLRHRLPPDHSCPPPPTDPAPN